MNFIQLFQMLDTNQSTNAKRSALVEFIKNAHPLESALAVEALTGRRERRHLKTSLQTSRLSGIADEKVGYLKSAMPQLETFQRPL